MRKSVSIIMCFVLLFTFGCSGLKITGKPYYEKGSAEELMDYLKQGTGKLTKQEVKEKIGGRPELLADANSERWVYKYTKIKDSSHGFILFSKKRIKTTTKELELTFDKDGILQNYKIKDNDTESSERVNKTDHYSHLVTDGMLTAAIAAAILIAVDLLRTYVKERIKKE